MHTSAVLQEVARRSFPAIFARGGTSNGLVIHARDLPPKSEWHKVLPAAMGSPDPYGRQLDGMGSGISSTSKICVLSSSSRPDADVDFTFVQVGVKDGSVDMAGNCGNMSSIVGPVSLDEGLVEMPKIETEIGTGYQTALVRIFNTNTSKVVHSRFRVAGDPPRYCAEGDYEMDGVPGKHFSRIVLSFISPGGAKTGRSLPTGNPVDTLSLPDGATIEASLVDVSNPGVFVRVSDLGIKDPEALDPPTIEANAALKVRLEQIRQAGAAMMGLDPKIESVPKIVLVFPPSLGQQSPRVDIRCLALSMGQAHKAVPLTLALCLGAATRLPGTIPHRLATETEKDDAVVIGHPSGRLEVGTTVENGEVLSAELHRTARVLMKGEVFY
jgi:2-methylaconitate cis-trans-isomerase PrpF